MTKEELKKLMQIDRPNQQILEVIDFRSSDRGIEGELYLATVKVRTVRATLDGVDDVTSIAEDMPYPLGPFKAINDAKINKMLERSKIEFDKSINMINKNLGIHENHYLLHPAISLFLFQVN